MLNSAFKHLLCFCTSSAFVVFLTACGEDGNALGRHEADTIKLALGSRGQFSNHVTADEIGSMPSPYELVRLINSESPDGLDRIRTSRLFVKHKIIPERDSSFVVAAEPMIARALLGAHEQPSTELIRITWTVPPDPSAADKTMRPCLILFLVFDLDDEWELRAVYRSPDAEHAINFIRLEYWEGLPRWIVLERGGNLGTGLAGTSESWFEIPRRAADPVLRLRTYAHDANTSLWVRGGMISHKLLEIDGAPAILAPFWHEQVYVGAPSPDTEGEWERNPLYRPDQEFIRFGLVVFRRDTDCGHFVLREDLSDWSVDALETVGVDRVMFVTTPDALRPMHSQKGRGHD